MISTSIKPCKAKTVQQKLMTAGVAVRGGRAPARKSAGGKRRVDMPWQGGHLHAPPGAWKQAGLSAKAPADIAGVRGGAHPCMPKGGNRCTNQGAKPATGMDALEVCC